MKKVEAPLLIIHGKSDTLIPFQHAVSLKKVKKGYVQVYLSEFMDHNHFSINKDMIDPIKKFIGALDFEQHQL